MSEVVKFKNLNDLRKFQLNIINTYGLKENIYFYTSKDTVEYDVTFYFRVEDYPFPKLVLDRISKTPSTSSVAVLRTQGSTPSVLFPPIPHFDYKNGWYFNEPLLTARLYLATDWPDPGTTPFKSEGL